MLWTYSRLCIYYINVLTHYHINSVQINYLTYKESSLSTRHIYHTRMFYLCVLTLQKSTVKIQELCSRFSQGPTLNPEHIWLCERRPRIPPACSLPWEGFRLIGGIRWPAMQMQPLYKTQVIPNPWFHLAIGWVSRGAHSRYAFKPAWELGIDCMGSWRRPRTTQGRTTTCTSLKWGSLSGKQVGGDIRIEGFLNLMQ